MQTHWKLERTLRQYGKTPMALARASGLTKTTIYNMVNASSQAVQLETLDKLLVGLEKLTGIPMRLTDVLEREAKPNALLEELLQGTKPIDFSLLEQHIPDWTTEEQQANQMVMDELELERTARIQQQERRDTTSLFKPKAKKT